MEGVVSGPGGSAGGLYIKNGDGHGENGENSTAADSKMATRILYIVWPDAGVEQTTHN